VYCYACALNLKGWAGLERAVGIEVYREENGESKSRLNTNRERWLR